MVLHIWYFFNSAPTAPRKLQVKETLSKSKASSGNEIYDVRVSWDEPDMKPDYYIVLLMVFSPNATKNYVNISGVSTLIIIC